MKLKLFCIALAAFMQLACAPVDGFLGVTSSQAPQAQCRAAGAETVLGQTLDARLMSEAILGAGALRSRVIQPGAAVTMDSDPMRLNLEVDERGRIRRLRCG